MHTEYKHQGLGAVLETFFSGAAKGRQRNVKPELPRFPKELLDHRKGDIHLQIQALKREGQYPTLSINKKGRPVYAYYEKRAVYPNLSVRHPDRKPINL